MAKERKWRGIMEEGKEESELRMKNAKDEDKCASFSWWQDSHNRPPQSPWLQAALSDLDEKTKEIVSMIDQNDGDSFAKRAEMFYERRPELISTIQELHRSYDSLAQKYKQLPSRASSSSSVTVNGRSQLSYEVKPSATPQTEKKVEDEYNDDGGLRLRVLKMTEDSLYQQAELMRTNNHHREAIRHFCSRLNSLMDQHRDLRNTFLPT